MAVNSVKDFSMSLKFTVQNVALLVLLVLPLTSVLPALQVETIPLQIVIVSLVISLMVKTYVKIVTINVNLVIMKMKETSLAILVLEIDITHHPVLAQMVSIILTDQLCVHNVLKFVILVPDLLKTV